MVFILSLGGPPPQVRAGCGLTIALFFGIIAKELKVPSVKNITERRYGFMAQQLKKGMYGEEQRQTGDLFGIRCGQLRSIEKITHNSGWYNIKGEKLGWGDLSAQDFRRISAEIDPNEVFFVLSEHASHGAFMTEKEVLDPLTGKEVKEDAPGINYVAEHAMYIITQNRLVKVDRWSKKEALVQYGLSFFVVNKQDL